ncbi:MAG: hypothetical protein R3E12_06830 [Candidatus Eisenbacteria bacterium]|uniref:Uncharacterized protein n=1 Tax=Eiseniibacteriota bacterium TaxID=2212470 RepID=A0A956LV52_UNCEI|nr:hypothetical protein [Candidatus Eisenbacteria bacterium]
MGRILVGALIAIAVVFGLMSVMHKKGAESPATIRQETALISTVTGGERIELAQHVPDQGVAVVEFTADW